MRKFIFNGMNIGYTAPDRAQDVTYDNISSGLSATTTQTAIDELTVTVNDKVDKEEGKGLFSGSYNDLSNKPSLSTVATSGSYNDLSNKPTIPTNNNQLTNGAGYITSSGTSAYTNYLASNTRMDYGWNGVNYFNLDATAASTVKQNNGPTKAWWHIMRFNHANNAGYYTDLAIPFDNTGIYYKRVTNGAVQNNGWIKVWDQLNLTNLNQLTNGPGYITSSGSCNYATSAGSAGSATKASILDGFGSGGAGNFTWGNQTGTGIWRNNDGGGGEFGFRKNNPSSGQVSMVIDGTVYVNEGRYQVWDKGNLTNLNQLTNGPGYITSSGSITGSANSLKSGSWTFCNTDSYGRTTLYGNKQGVTLNTGNNWLFSMQADGNAVVYQNSTAKWSTGTSSRRFKHNIQDMTEERAKKILEIRPVTFDWNNGEPVTTQATDNAGVIAEEVSQVIPDLVVFEDTEDGGKTERRVEYERFTPYLIKMVQIQQEQIGKQQEEIDLLKQEIELLKNKGE